MRLEEEFDITIPDADANTLFNPTPGEYGMSNTPQQGSINSIAEYIDKCQQNL